MTGEANRYLATAIAAVRARAYRAGSVDWAVVSAEARERLAGPTARDAHDAVRYVLAALGDRHSFLRTPEQWSALTAPRPAVDLMLPSGAAIGPGVWRLDIPPTIGGDDSDLARAYVEASHAVVREGQAHNVHTWIVDLTGNRGGSVVQMLAAVGPLLGPLDAAGPVVGYVDRDGVSVDATYDDGVVRHGDLEVLRFDDSPDGTPVPRLAVLVDRTTASAAEAIAAAFVAHPNARLFGEPTFGATTGNDEVELPDGASLFIATGVVRNSRGTAFPERISPDVRVDPNCAFDAALAWARSRRDV